MAMSKNECEERAADLAKRILRANHDPLELQYAVGQLVPLYEMIADDDEATGPGDIYVAPGKNDLTFGSLLDWLIGEGFERVENLAPDRRHRFYTGCKQCSGTDEQRNHPRTSSLSVKHEADCLFAKHLPRLRAMANRDVT